MSDAKQIYVDMDDVLAETGRTFLRVLREEFGKQVEWDQIHDYDLGVSLGLDERIVDGDSCTHPSSPRSWPPWSPFQESLAALERWIEQGYEIEVVTGRPSSTEEISRNWLKNNEMPHHSLIHVDKYAWEEELLGTSSGVPLVRLADNGYSSGGGRLGGGGHSPDRDHRCTCGGTGPALE